MLAGVRLELLRDVATTPPCVELHCIKLIKGLIHGNS